MDKLNNSKVLESDSASSMLSSVPPFSALSDKIVSPACSRPVSVGSTSVTSASAEKFVNPNSFDRDYGTYFKSGSCSSLVSQSVAPHHETMAQALSRKFYRDAQRR